MNFMKRMMNLLPQVSFSILSLYSAIKQLDSEGLIEEMPFENQRRRYYRLTKKGWDRLGAEIDYFDNTLKLAKARRAFGHFMESGQYD
jgi:DNA-binding PadR family transcriptional regulator